MRFKAAVWAAIIATAALVGTEHASTATDPAIVGQWSTVIPWPFVAIHAHLLNTGKVLSWQNGATATVWDPATGIFTAVPNSFTDLLCAGHNFLPDGRFVTIGGAGFGPGVADVTIFDPVSLTWTRAASMNVARWYPNLIVRPDGRPMAISGSQDVPMNLAPTPESYDPPTNTWTLMNEATNVIPYYPFTFILPDGRLFVSGASEQAYASQAYDFSTHTWTAVDPTAYDGASAVMYEPGKILKAGSASDGGFPPDPSSAQAYVVDMNQPGPLWRQVASMAFPRSFVNLTSLPDGTVLATGGGTTKDGQTLANAVLPAELWSPITETWTTMAGMATPRLYHSEALLLPDARVFVGGSGGDAGVADQMSAEIYSPPYLFKGARPSIASAPSVVNYGGAFTVTTPDAASIATVRLISLGSVTHGFNMNQHAVSLTFTATTGALTVTAPATANLAPPGYYMLFLINSNGVPSTASIVQLPVGTAPPPPSPAPGATIAVDATVSADGNSTVTTQPFSTVAAGELLVAFVASDGPAPGSQSLSVSGAGLSWSLIRRLNAQAGASEIWAAKAPGTLTNATVTSTATSAGFAQSLAVVAFTGANGIGVSAGSSAPSGTPAVTLTSTEPGSLIYGVGNDWDNAIARTPGTGQTVFHQFLAPAGDTFWFQSRTSPAAGAGVQLTLSDTAPTLDRWNLAAVEIVPGNSAPAQVVVPNVLALTQATAIATITSAQLTVGTTTNAPSTIVAAGSVISQTPSSGTLVAPGTTVNLVISSGPALVTVPNVANLTQAAASTAIGAAGLVVGTITTAVSGTVPAGSVISQSPSAGATVAQGSAVALVVCVAATAVVSVDASSNSDGSGTQAVTGFSTTTAGDVLVAFAASDGPMTDPQTLTVAGAGLAWVLVARANAEAGVSEIWTATTSSVLNNAIIASTPSLDGFHGSLTVIAFKGAGGIGASATASAGSGATALPLTTTRSGSLVYAVGNDWDSATPRVPGANQTIVHQWIDSAVGDTFWVQSAAAPIPGPATTVRMSDSAPTSDRWNFAAVEIVSK